MKLLVKLKCWKLKNKGDEMNAIKCKTILTKSKLPNVDYCYNAYVGCTHSCKYCYATFMKRFTGHGNEQWGSFIDYKENAIDVLQKEVKRIERDKWVLMGSVTDSYQPIEKKLLLTRKSLEIFLSNQIPISILTKSDLIVRDIDILSRFDKCEVGISYSFTDEKIASVLEPNASSLYKRVSALKQLKQAGIKTYIFIGPIIPQLTKLKDIFNIAGQYADFIMAEALNLRCGNLNALKIIIEELAGEENGSEIIGLCKNKDYWTSIENEYKELCKDFGIENRGLFVHTS